MGNEKHEEVVEKLEDMLGLGEEKKEETAKETSKTSETPKEEKKEEKKEDKKEEEQKPQTQVVTSEQITIQKDIAKIETKIDELQKSEVDMNEFYANIEKELSEKEQQLEYDDKPAYMKLLNEKANEYKEKNSSSKELEELTQEKEELESIYERQNAIVAVSAKHPDYNHDKMLEYFNEDLSKSEQAKIFNASQNYEDVYENTYKRYLEANPAKVKDVPAPNIPNVNNTRKQSPSNSDTDGDMMSEDERLQKALGL